MRRGSPEPRRSFRPRRGRGNHEPQPRAGADRVDDDGGRAFGTGDDNFTEVVGAEPHHHRVRRQGAAGGKGFEGERSFPSPDGKVDTSRVLAHGTDQRHEPVHVINDNDFESSVRSTSDQKITALTHDRGDQANRSSSPADR